MLKREVGSQEALAKLHTIAAKLEIMAESQPKVDTAKIDVEINKILKLVNKHFEISSMELMSDRRHAQLIPTRLIAYHLCRKLTEASYPHIGLVFDRDHTTIMQGEARAKSLLKDHAPLQEMADKVEKDFMEWKRERESPRL